MPGAEKREKFVSIRCSWIYIFFFVIALDGLYNMSRILYTFYTIFPVIEWKNFLVTRTNIEQIANDLWIWPFFVNQVNTHTHTANGIHLIKWDSIRLSTASVFRAFFLSERCNQKWKEEGSLKIEFPEIHK